MSAEDRGPWLLLLASSATVLPHFKQLRNDRGHSEEAGGVWLLCESGNRVHIHRELQGLSVFETPPLITVCFREFGAEQKDLS